MPEIIVDSGLGSRPAIAVDMTPSSLAKPDI
jgi:hypothetical protein